MPYFVTSFTGPLEKYYLMSYTELLNTDKFHLTQYKSH